jgi:glycosyltransferase involved in cell wall biosynthesis
MAKYSIVVPFHNEEENVTVLYARLKQVMEQVGDSYELVLVDDGSNDRTYKLMGEIAAVDSRVLLIKLRRNFGQTSALAAGFDHASGEFILAMDGDLQHDPSEIPNFLEKLEEGYDVVSGWRKERVDNLIMRRIPSRCANWLMAKLSGVDIHLQSLSPRGNPEYSALRRDAPLHPRAGQLVWRVDLRDSHQEHTPRTGQEPLRHRAHLRRLL